MYMCMYIYIYIYIYIYTQYPIFKCDIPVGFYEFNMYSVKLTVKTQLIYCTLCTMYKNYMFRPILAIFRVFV